MQVIIVRELLLLNNFMKLYIVFIFFILTSCRFKEKNKSFDYISLNDTKEEIVELRLPIYMIDTLIIEVLEYTLETDKECWYYDSLKTFYSIFFLENTTPDLFSVNSGFKDMYDFSQCYGAFNFNGHFFTLKGRQYPLLLKETNDSLTISYLKQDPSSLIMIDDSRSYWYFAIYNDSIYLKSESLCLKQKDKP